MISGPFLNYYEFSKSVVFHIINNAKKIFESEPTIQHFHHSKQVTVVGDVHGQFHDFMDIFRINGEPSESNAFIFNGDFVDRGKDGCEIMIMLLVYKIIYPDYVLLNRGNHETETTTSMFGFKRECEMKYDLDVYKQFISLFEVLPIGCLIENVVSKKRVFVVHGGIYEKYEEFDLEWVRANVKNYFNSGFMNAVI